MSDDLHTTGEAPEPQEYYTETVVEYVDNRRQRAALGIVVLLLFLLLIGVTYAVVRLTPGKGAPTGKADLPEGIEWVRSIYGWGSAPDQALRTPTDVAIARDGTIWVVSGHEMIAGFNPDGSPKKAFKAEGAGSPEGIAVGPDGNLYVADFAGQLLAYSTDGELIDSWKVELPSEVDVRDGKIAVASAYGVAVFTFDDEMLLKLGGARGWAEDQFDLPHGIRLGDDGTLFVSDTQNRRVKAYGPDGRIKWISGEAPDRSKPGVADVRSGETSIGAQPFALPSGMTIDGNGRIVLVDPFKFRIAVLDPNTGEVVREKRADGSPGRQAFYGEYGAADGFFSYPTGIDYDPARDWFAVADTANNRVQIIRLPGSGGSIFAPILGAFRAPMLVCCIPWILLLVALGLALARRRRERELAEQAGAGPDAAASAVQAVASTADAAPRADEGA